MKSPLAIIPLDLLATYTEQVSGNLPEAFDALKDAESSTPSFSFYTSVSAMASSKIEGEKLEIDSYVKHKMLNVEYLPDLTQKPDDLYNTYLFAQQHQLNKINFLQGHAILTKHLLPESKQGVYRAGNMVVMEHHTGRIQYEAVPAQQVGSLSELLWSDIETLKAEELSHTEVFYFAAFIHLVFVNIHPFEDGNGRAGRLLEKWFIAEKLGVKAWYLQSELYYYKHVNDYYKNLNKLGLFYEELDYSRALPFIMMLPSTLSAK
ncbi:MAG: Fic family protein [Bacteroidetes bacterium]|nr:Fic family protein [Bacteroidota bacterium]